MPMRALAALVLIAGAGCLANRAVYQRRTAAQLEPAPLRATPSGGGPVGRARVRVYIDQDYRVQNPGHEHKIRRLLDHANEMLEPTVGLRLELADVRAWERKSGDNLQGALDELEALDTATDVDFVFGMVNALSRVSTELHELGRARVLGHHMVVRGLNDAAEVASLDRMLGTISARQRQGLYTRRKRHKELLIFLHEIAHTLGGLHVTDEDNILFPTYQHRQSSFGVEDARLMRMIARARLAQDQSSDQRGWGEVLTYLREKSWTGWNEDEKEILLAELDNRAKGAEQSTTAEPLGESMRAADRDRFRAAERLSASGRALDAWEELEPLVGYYPDEPAVQRFACRLAVQAGRDRSMVELRCGHAARAAPGDAEPHLRLAQSYLADDRPKSLAAARKARDALAAGSGAATASAAGTLWGELAAHFQQLGAVSWAEEAAGKATSGKAVAEWASTSRARYGIAPRGPIRPEEEAEYVTGVRDLLTLVYDHKFREAERKVADLQRRFRGAAGIDAARCDLEIRRRAYAAARGYCREAIRRYDGSSWAHYLTGLLDKRDKNPTAAIKHLERAIELDPDLEHAYQISAELYAQLKREADRKRIAEQFQTKFGRPLPK